MFLSQNRERLEIVHCSNPNTLSGSQPLKFTFRKKFLQFSILQAGETNRSFSGTSSFPNTTTAANSPSLSPRLNHTRLSSEGSLPS